MKNTFLEIPYRLETIEDINNAMHDGLLRSVDYQRLLHFAKTTTLHKPPALMKAKQKVTKNFNIVNDKKIQDVNINISAFANLPLIAHYQLIMESIPWIDDIICHDNLFQFFSAFPLDIRKRLFLENLPISPGPMYSSIVAIRKVIKRELIVYIKACKTKALSLVQLKKSLVALTVFETRNEDVLIALKTTQTSQDSPLRQNALAEILFARLPKTIQQFLTSNTDTIIKKLSLKMSHLNLSPRHIMNLMGYIHKRMNPDDLCKTLSRIDGVAMKISIPQEAKNRLHDYLESLKKNMDRAPLVYRALFLIPELETFQKLYRPTRVMESVETVTEKTIRQYTLSSTLEFHVTKDHFDLIKSKYSSDCTDTYLGEKQLMTPFFFNIRIFKDEEWIGNIYMLDFSEEHNSLIIDRVQMPRELEASYYQFFDYLKEILIEMFKDVHYKYILMPLRISNHESIQRMFNHYKKGLSKKGQFINSSYSFNFESLSGRKSYYVLYKQTKA